MTDSRLLILALLVLLALGLWLLLARRRWQAALHDLEGRYRES